MLLILPPIAHSIALLPPLITDSGACLVLVLPLIADCVAYLLLMPILFPFLLLPLIAKCGSGTGDVRVVCGCGATGDRGLDSLFDPTTKET